MGEKGVRLSWRQKQEVQKDSLPFRCLYHLRRRQWQPTSVLLPGKSHGCRSLVGCSPWCREESDTTECLHFHFSFSCTGEGNGNPLQCSCLEDPRDRGAWWAAVYGVAQSWTRLKRLSNSSSSNHLQRLSTHHLGLLVPMSPHFSSAPDPTLASHLPCHPSDPVITGQCTVSESSGSSTPLSNLLTSSMSPTPAFSEPTSSSWRSATTF